jgi:hypothetical protein
MVQLTIRISNLIVVSHLFSIFFGIGISIIAELREDKKQGRGEKVA